MSPRRSAGIIGIDRIIGLSTHSLDQFQRANTLDVDYLAFGPIFPTQTRDYSIGTADIREALRVALKPVVFIGGVNTATSTSFSRRGSQRGADSGHHAGG
jgi:thiamine-phosphate pyrophosphorylase